MATKNTESKEKDKVLTNDDTEKDTVINDNDTESGTGDVEEGTEENKDTSVESTTNKNKKTEKTAKTANKANKPKPKKFAMDDMILCRSVRHGDLIYTGYGNVEWRWSGYGDEQLLPYRDIVSMKSQRSKFLYEPWILIMDDELMAQSDYQKAFGDIHKAYEMIGDPEEFFEKPLNEIREALAIMPSGLKDYIIYCAGQFIRDGILDRISVIRTMDDAFGTNMRELI